MENVVRIIGGGLAGAEAAWQLARRGISVELFEMRPQRMTEAHAGGDLGELVCSNSLRSDLLSAPAGLLKAEMRGSIPSSFAAPISTGCRRARRWRWIARILAAALTETVEAVGGSTDRSRRSSAHSRRWHRHHCHRAAHFAGIIKRIGRSIRRRASLFLRRDFADCQR